MNQVNLIGRIVKDIESKQSGNGNVYTNFTLAVNDFNGKEKITQFINCVAFGKTAETIIAYVKKGNQLAIEGKLQITFDKEKNTTYVSVPVNKITLIESNTKEHPAQTRARYEDTRPAPDSDILKNSNILWED